MLHIASAVASHPGQRRAENEDAFGLREDLGLFVVADGMGGHAAGEVASRTAVEAMEQFMATASAPEAGSSVPSDEERVVAAFHHANECIRAAIASNAGLTGMATTAAALLVAGDRVLIAHVGDSRVYRARAGEWEQLTSDHSWVNEQLRAGLLTEAEARRHPYRHVVTRALSGTEAPNVDVTTYDAEDGDLVLLCSDGLSNMVPVEAISNLVGRAASLDAACGALIDAANAAGGPDNITALLVEFHVD